MRRVLLLLAIAGCAANARRVERAAGARAPAVTRSEASLAAPLAFGSPGRADLERRTSLEPADCLSVRVHFLRFDERPRLPGAAPLDHRVRAAIDPVTGAARLAPLLAAGGLFLDADSARRLGEGELLGDVQAALPDDVTLRIVCYTERPEPAPVVSGAPAPLATERVGLLLRRRVVARDPRRGPSFSLDLALALRSIEPPPPPPEPEAPGTKATYSQRTVERLRLLARASTRERSDLLELAPRPIESRALLGAVVPSPFAGDPGWIAVLLELAPAPAASDPGARLHERAVASVEGQLAAERASAARAAAPQPPPWAFLPVDRPPLDLAAFRAELRTWPRRGLSLLATTIAAPVAQDATLGSDDAVLVDVSLGVERALEARSRLAAAGAALGGAGGAASLPRTLRWDVDFAVLRALLRAPDRARPLVERLFGVAFESDLTGIGRGLLSGARRAASHEEVERLAVVRNLLALEDTRAGLRVVAARWLAGFDPGLEGYDPLAPFEERRLAVDRLWLRLAPEETP